MSVAIALHVLSAIIWIGGMFFAYVCLRPVATEQLDPSQRLPLWNSTFARFFQWVWLAAGLLLATGFWMAFSMFGDMAAWPIHIHLMMAGGIVMIFVFLHIYFAPYRRLTRFVAVNDFQKAGAELGRIRKLVAINLSLGTLVAVFASAGRYL